MKKSKCSIYILLFIVLASLFSVTSFAQKKRYNDLSTRELLLLLKEECQKGQMANCYEAGQMYLSSSNEDLHPKGKKLVNEACQGGHENACEFLRGGLARDTGSSILFYSSIGLIGLAVFLVTIMMFQDEEEFKAAEKLEESDKKDTKFDSYGIVLRYSRPFFKRYI